jgi:SOS-response transcriptional repressor LexA
MTKTGAARPLTERQRAILAFIVGYWGERQTMPTLREIMRAFNISGPNGVVGHLKALARKGWVEVAEVEHRGIRVPMLADAAKEAAANCLRKLPRASTHERGDP